MAFEPDRPQPLKDVAQTVGLITASVGGIVTALVGYGVLTVDRGNAITGLLGLIPGLVTAVTAVFAAQRVASVAKHLVTPLTDPRTNDGTRLVPENVPGLVVDPVNPVDLPSKGVTP